ncbi:MAG TPA: VWA domain-containing protein, partial [Rhizomicrobium sp.]|nr:VWA domain-containing protein [Rhizomicrobium sp.]
GGMIRPISMIPDQEDTVDLAIRSHVIINGLDAPGLIASVRQIPLQQRVARTETLWEMADGTGGQFVHDTNDLFGGFERLAAAPEVTYLLGFSPQNLKLNGKFHTLKVKVRPAGLSVQARTGYRAPTHLASAAETASEEIREAVFSRGEIKDIGIDIETEVSRRIPAEATLSVVSRIDVSQLHYRKADGRNIDDIELVCALFDRNGVYIDSLIRTIRLRLLDDTLRNRVGAGIPIRSDFKVPPGTYAIRVVARDSEGAMMAAQNGAAVIPR